MRILSVSKAFSFSRLNRRWRPPRLPPLAEPDLELQLRRSLATLLMRSRANLPFYLGPLIYADLSKDFTEFESAASPIGPCPRVSPTPIAITATPHHSKRFLPTDGQHSTYGCK